MVRSSWDFQALIEAGGGLITTRRARAVADQALESFTGRLTPAVRLPGKTRLQPGCGAGERILFFRIHLV
jgi:hypothetical protein